MAHSPNWPQRCKKILYTRYCEAVFSAQIERVISGLNLCLGLREHFVLSAARNNAVQLVLMKPNEGDTSSSLICLSDKHKICKVYLLFCCNIFPGIEKKKSMDCDVS